MPNEKKVQVAPIEESIRFEITELDDLDLVGVAGGKDGGGPTNGSQCQCEVDMGCP